MTLKAAKLMVLAIGLWSAALFVPSLAAQSTPGSGPDTGGNELQVWTGGGHSLAGGERDSGAWNVGARYGWILTQPHGPSVLRGRFEYAVDAVPIFWIFQPTTISYGAGVDPFSLKWNFMPRRGLAPYFDTTGGVLFSNRETPPGTSRVNFTTSAAFGSYLLRKKHNVSAEIRFLHISNAGIKASNLGINTLQVRIGFGLFTRGN